MIFYLHFRVCSLCNMVYNKNNLKCFNCGQKHSHYSPCKWKFCVFCWRQWDHRGTVHRCNRRWVEKLFPSQGAYRRHFEKAIEQQWTWKQLETMFRQMKKNAAVQVPEQVQASPQQQPGPAVQRIQPSPQQHDPLVQQPTDHSPILSNQFPEVLAAASTRSIQVPVNPCSNVLTQVSEEDALIFGALDLCGTTALSSGESTAQLSNQVRDEDSVMRNIKVERSEFDEEYESQHSPPTQKRTKKGKRQNKHELKRKAAIRRLNLKNERAKIFRRQAPANFNNSNDYDSNDESAKIQTPFQLDVSSNTEVIVVKNEPMEAIDD